MDTGLQEMPNKTDTMPQPQGKNPLMEYFANLPGDQIAAELMKRVDDFYEYLQRSGRMSLMRLVYRQFYRGRMRGGRMSTAGEQDEYTMINVNHLRNILSHLIVNTTSQRPDFEPKAINTDTESQSQTIVARNVLDFYMRDKGLEQLFERVCEYAVAYSEGYIGPEWDPTLGEVYTQGEQGQPIKQGDIVVSVYAPYDVISDFTRMSPYGHNWRITRKFVNKYDIMAKFPGMADKINGLTMSGTILREKAIEEIQSKRKSDLLALFTFYHDKTPAVPEGRIVQFLASDVKLLDGPLPYKTLPIYRMAPSEQDGTAFGYTIAFDLLPIQECIDKLYSVVVTNQSSFGVQNILMPDGSTITVSEIAGGLNVIKYDPKLGKPEALQLLSTPKEIFAFIEMLEHLMETLSGVNSVSRGNPEASLKSGAALALVAAQAIQFNSGLQKAYIKLLEDMGTGIIQILQMYATTPRMIVIAGKSNRSLIKQFQGSDIDKVIRVQVDVGNPLSRTTAGKMQIAQDLLQNQLIKNAEQYIEVLTTGRLEPLIEDQQQELLLIRSENERLSNGQTVQAMMTDNPVTHIKGAMVVLSSPEARENPKVVKATTDHIMEHIQLWQQSDPSLMGMLGYPPPPPMIVQPKPTNGGAPGNPGQSSDVENPTDPALSAAAGVNMPKMPQAPAGLAPAVA